MCNVNSNKLCNKLIENGTGKGKGVDIFWVRTKVIRNTHIQKTVQVQI